MLATDPFSGYEERSTAPCDCDHMPISSGELHFGHMRRHLPSLLRSRRELVNTAPLLGIICPFRAALPPVASRKKHPSDFVALGS